MSVIITDMVLGHGTVLSAKKHLRKSIYLSGPVSYQDF